MTYQGSIVRIAAALAMAAPAAAQTLTAVSPYTAVTDRVAYAKPPLPALGPAGSTFVDPVFRSTIRRLTDAATRPAWPNRSYRTPSSPHQNAWSVSSRYFYVMGSDGVGPIPFAFDPATGTARRLQPSASADGGLVLTFYIEPQFSYVNDSIIYGSYSGPGANLHTIDQYDFSTGLYTRLLDLEALVPNLAGTYIGGVASSAGPTERIEAFFGGIQQDYHHYVVVFDRANPQNRQIVDTLASTINGQPSPIPLNFSLHHVMIDRSGRYVMLYTTSADQTGPRHAAQEYLWDLQTGGVTELGPAARPYGHDAFGYGALVNQDCCVATSYDGAQWQFRSLASPLVTRDLLATVPSPQEVYIADHTTWNSARPDGSMPVISGLYRYGAYPNPWRTWDDEIIAIQTNAAAGADPTVWRFAHHRSDVTYDGDATRTSFWYEPHPNVSQDGKWVLFTSNWEKTLGTDPGGELGTMARQDVFLLALKPAAAGAPASPPLAVTTSSLPRVRATQAYSASLLASGGSGRVSWRIDSGSLPTGIALDPVTGALAGIPTTAGTASFVVRVTDASDPANTATASLSITVDPPPVQVAATALAGGRAGTAYSAALTASGGSGSYRWAVAAGALPPGIAIDAASGVLGGMPTAAGVYAFTASAADAADPANAGTASFSITVSTSSLGITTAALPSGRQRVAYSAALQATGASGPIAWSAAAALPAGLTLDGSTGLIAGTPSAAGTYTVAIKATDSADATNSATATFALSIAAAIKVTSPRTLPDAYAGVAYSYTITSANAVGTATWNLQGGALPPGLSLESTTGAITGTPTTTGTYSFNARVTDSTTDATRTLTITVR